mmetsp:Transcript_91476/g.167769  ORF Transcript_91476/g.167769 Transcript_91476/m.167769 type:complete len:91 (+) Transcript_91476:1-273(+)
MNVMPNTQVEPPSGISFAKSAHAKPPVPPAPPPLGPTGSLPSQASGAGGDEQKHRLMQRLMQLTPDQIAKLPEGTKVQLLQFLQQNSQQR